MSLPYKCHKQKLELIKKGELSLADNVSSFLKNIEDKKHLNIYNFIFDDALVNAAHIEKKIKSGSYGKLAGMVIAIKDVLAIKDKPLTCSSKILKDYISIYTSTAVQKLIDEDAVIIGKTNCDEFAMGSSNENSFFGVVKNPVDETRVPGGSSGGSAAAAAAFLCDASIGTDTGGSIRQPASFCGVYGLKPTYGKVSRYGLTAFASSFDTIGPFTNSLEDAELILDVIAGKDPLDSTSIEMKKHFEPIGKFKIGIPKEYFASGISSEVEAAIKNLTANLSSNNIELVNISLPHTEYTIAAYYILTTAEASSNLARYDGARYGFRSAQSSSLNEMYKNSRSEGFGSEVKRRIMLGAYVLSSGYYDAYYLKAQKVRRLIKQDFEKAFSQVDVILTPTSPTTAFKIGERSDDALQMYLSDIYTVSANLAGIPGINIPIGNSAEGLPIGAQLLGNYFEEEKLFYAGREIINTLN